MRCPTRRFSRQIQPRKASLKKRQDATVDSIDQQCFEEILGYFHDKDRNHLISYCFEFFLDDGDEQVRKEYLRREIDDENSLISAGRLMMKMGSFDRIEWNSSIWKVWRKKIKPMGLDVRLLTTISTHSWRRTSLEKGIDIRSVVTGGSTRTFGWESSIFDRRLFERRIDWLSNEGMRQGIEISREIVEHFNDLVPSEREIVGLALHQWIVFDSFLHISSFSLGKTFHGETTETSI